jgi:hypothetical protein
VKRGKSFEEEEERWRSERKRRKKAAAKRTFAYINFYHMYIKKTKIAAVIEMYEEMKK